MSTKSSIKVNGAAKARVVLLNSTDLITPEQAQAAWQHDENLLDKKSYWVRGTKTDVQVINAICKKLAADAYKGWENHSCQMDSRHKTQLMIGLSYLIPKFIEHNKLHTGVVLNQILRHLLSASLENHNEAWKVEDSVKEHISKEMEKLGRDKFDPWKEEDTWDQ